MARLLSGGPTHKADHRPDQPDSERDRWKGEARCALQHRVSCHEPGTAGSHSSGLADRHRGGGEPVAWRRPPAMAGSARLPLVHDRHRAGVRQCDRLAGGPHHGGRGADALVHRPSGAAPAAGDGGGPGRPGFRGPSRGARDAATAPPRPGRRGRVPGGRVRAGRGAVPDRLGDPVRCGVHPLRRRAVLRRGPGAPPGGSDGPLGDPAPRPDGRAPGGGSLPRPGGHHRGRLARGRCPDRRDAPGGGRAGRPADRADPARPHPVGGGRLGGRRPPARRGARGDHGRRRGRGHAGGPAGRRPGDS